MLKSNAYIAVEGPIGVGKSTFTKLLADMLNARLILEEVSENPFVADFYRDPKRYAFQTQITFLILRYRQLATIKQLDLFHEITVSDYLLEKDDLFARLTLDEREYGLYQKIAGLFRKDEMPSTPDLVVYLQAPPERLMMNIKMRNRNFEQDISETYIRDLSEIYSQFFFNWTKSPLLIINNSKFDFQKNQEHKDRLLNIIKNIPNGTTYFNLEEI